MKGRFFSIRHCIVLLFGLTPFLAGWLLAACWARLYWTLFRPLSALLFGAVWYLLAFLARDLLEDGKQAVLFLNLPALIVMLLVGVQLAQGGFWPAPAGLWSWYFFLPIGGAFFSNWRGPLAPVALPPYLLAFLTMVLISVVFCFDHRGSVVRRG